MPLGEVMVSKFNFQQLQKFLVDIFFSTVPQTFEIVLFLTFFIGTVYSNERS